jgi:hypothetical protein
VEGIEITSVHWIIEHNDGYVKEGDIDVTSPEATISAEVVGVPPALGYALRLTAEATTGDYDCEGNATFDVFAGQKTAVNMTLQCIDNSSSTIVIIGERNFCPQIDFLTVSPLVQGVGSQITVYAEASDIDEDDALSYSWTAAPDDNSFDAPEAPATHFDCELGGNYILTLTVADGELTADDTCVTSKDIPVECHFDGVCEEGYYSTGRNCEDINESEDEIDNCDQQCTNTDGGYLCACDVGYELDDDEHDYWGG